ncbi:VWA domain-containing protein [Candidatus Nitrosopelagicus sp.]|nr:VWA domain-containing protein [Candidatus Nitrosopelagicus sp.]
MDYEFGYWYVLLALFVLPGFYYLYRFYTKTKKSNSLKFSNLELVKSSISSQSQIRKHIPFILILVAVSLIIIGLADPRIPLENVQEGVNVVLVLDGSGSMAATDYPPTRLESAKIAAEILIDNLEPNDHTGIILFESGATTVSYLTPFKQKTIDDLQAIRQRDGATAIGDGLVLGVDMANSIPNKKKVVILLSDGDHNAGVVTPNEAVQYALQKKIQIHTIGMGSDEPVLLGTNIYGNPLYAELNETQLIAIATAANGKYYKSVDKNSLNEIFEQITDDIDRELEQVSIKDWFFIAAAIILAANIYIVYGKYRIVI